MNHESSRRWKVAGLVLLGAWALWDSRGAFATSKTECDILGKALRDEYLASEDGKRWLKQQEDDKVLRQDAPEIAADFEKALDIVRRAPEEERTLARAVVGGTLKAEPSVTKAKVLVGELDEYFNHLEWADCGSDKTTDGESNDEKGISVRCHKDWHPLSDYVPPKVVRFRYEMTQRDPYRGYFNEYWGQDAIDNGWSLNPSLNYNLCVTHSSGVSTCFSVSLGSLLDPSTKVTADIVFTMAHPLDGAQSPDDYVGRHLPDDCPGHIAPQWVNGPDCSGAVTPRPPGCDAIPNGPQAWHRSSKGNLIDDATADFDTTTVRSHSQSGGARVAPNRND